MACRDPFTISKISSHTEFQKVYEVCQHSVLFSLLLWDSSVMQLFLPYSLWSVKYDGVCL